MLMSISNIRKSISMVMALYMMLAPVHSVDENVKRDIPFYTYGDVSNSDTRINASRISDMDTIVIPSGVTGKTVTMFSDKTHKKYHVSGALGETDFVSGESIDLAKLCNPDDYVISVSDGSEEYQIRFLFLDNIPSVYLLSTNPQSEGRQWVESSFEKANKATGSIVMQSGEGDIVYEGNLTQIKGRGNTTWGLDKKPYQIKLEKKADLLDTGDDENQKKTWILLANYLDTVGIRNTLALNLGNALGMESNVQGKSVDLYYDGEYRGMYMLTEKVEVGSGRVDVVDLEEENQLANPNINFEDFPVANGRTSNGAFYTYCKGIKPPKDITGGYLLEMDYETRAREEVCYIRTKKDMYIVVKSPEYASKEEMEYIATLYQEYEDAVYNDGVNPQTKKKYSDYIDEKSVAMYYLVNEFSKSRDSFNSSAYLHKDAGEEKFVMGPLWDYDMSFGKGSYDGYQVDDSPCGLSALNTKMAMALFSLDDFCRVTKNIFVREFSPLIKDVLLGDKDAVSEDGQLHSMEYYRQLVSASAYADTLMWSEGRDWTEEYNKLYDFVSKRQDVLTEHFDVFKGFGRIAKHNFYDVLPSDSYYEDVTKASRFSVLAGVGNGFYRPEYQVKRSLAAQLLFNMSGVGGIEYKEVYSDVPENVWYSDAAIWTYLNDYIDGYLDGTFRGNDFITREEYMNALYKFTGSPAVTINVIDEFDDYDLITKGKAMEWAVTSGILEKPENNCINPGGTMTRAEFAGIMVRYCKLYNIVPIV